MQLVRSLSAHLFPAVSASILVAGLYFIAACKPAKQAEAKVEVAKQLGVTGAGAALERVTSDPVTERSPAISPDGRTLLFNVRVYEGDTDELRSNTLVAVDPNTRAQRTLYTAETSAADHPAWLPDGSSYVYSSNSPGSWSLVRALTSAPNAAISVVVGGDVARSPGRPSVAPDGSRVVFSTMVQKTSNVAVIGLDGSRLTLLGEGIHPRWSPDGERVVFMRRVAGAYHLFLVNPNTGTDLVQLTSGDASSFDPAWSPDGRYIVFISNRGWSSTEGLRRNLFIVSRDGTGLTQLTNGTALNIEPAWGRDNWIYFASDQAGNFDVWRLKPTGKFADLESIAPSTGLAMPKAEPSPTEPATPPTGPATAPTGPATPPTKGGCLKDTDCKGERVCEKGVCVSPK